MNTFKKQSGMTLIELMLSMTLGLILLIGVMRIMIMTNNSAQLGDGMADVQETGRFAMAFLGDYVRQAGYQSGLGGKITPLLNCADAWCSADVDTNADTAEQDGGLMCDGFDMDLATNVAVGDRLSVQMNPDDDTDCTGSNNNIAVDDVIANVFWIDGTNNLRCRGYNTTKSEWVAQSMPIAENIQSMQFLVGESTNPSGQNDQSVNRYTDIATANPIRVYSIKVALVSRSDRIATLQERQRNFTLLDSNLYSPNDQCNRQVFTTTFNIANANQSEY